MRPIHKQSGYRTMDLTMGAIHRLKQDDGSVKIVAWFPKVWTQSEPYAVMGATGKELVWRHYDVTEFDEVVLAIVPAP